MKELPTAEEFFNQYGGYTREEMLERAIEFAKMHVHATLKKAYMDSKLIVIENDTNEEGELMDIYDDGSYSICVCKKSILDAYPDELIK